MVMANSRRLSSDSTLSQTLKGATTFVNGREALESKVQNTFEKEPSCSELSNGSLLPVYVKCTQCDGCGSLNADGKQVGAEESGTRLEKSTPCPSCAGFGKNKDPREFAKKILRKLNSYGDVGLFRNLVWSEFPDMESEEIDSLHSSVKFEMVLSQARLETAIRN